MEKRIGSPRILEDHPARNLMQDLEGLEQDLHIEGGVIYYDYPLFRDESGKLYRPQLVLVTKSHGMFLFCISNEIAKADQELTHLDSIVFAKLIKSNLLRKSKREVIVPITSVIYTTHQVTSNRSEVESKVASNLVGLRTILQEERGASLTEEQWKEVTSLLEGGKGIIRAKERDISTLPPTSKAAIFTKLEEGILNFDRDQRYAGITLVNGPQRIRGLAGSGKTIVLARKAAQLHLNNPEAQILFTFWTKSLYDLAKQLITRFYRQFDDRDPNWKKLHVLHGWGGTQFEGVYYNACVDNGQIPISLKQVPSSEPHPFEYVCRQLVKSGKIQPKYDHVLIDEGQDFPPSFYHLCFSLTKGPAHDRNVVWAYDELQTILQTDVQNVKETFGTDAKKEPLMDLERARTNLSGGLLLHDVVLHTCYRNPPEVLVAALALGFGLYSQEGVIVQMLENKEHWTDLGYKVEQGNCVPGEATVITRLPESSPLSLGKYVPREDIIQWFVADSFEDELKWAVKEIKKFLKGGLHPDDILVVCLDDRNARNYFRHIAKMLAESDINVNNILQQPFVEPQFYIQDHITLATVYRAKGNEAAVVIAMGLDAMHPLRNTRKGRNRIFTALTRSKAWVRISGTGSGAEYFTQEFKKAVENFPSLRFTYPDKKNIELIQRDLDERSAKIMDIQQALFDLGLTDISDEEIKQLIKGARGKKL